jgi:hypothetical protein
VGGSAFTGAALALRLATRGFVLALSFFFLEVVILLGSFCGSLRVMTFMPPSAATSKSILKKLLEKCAPPIPARLARDLAQL